MDISEWPVTIRRLPNRQEVGQTGIVTIVGGAMITVAALWFLLQGVGIVQSSAEGKTSAKTRTTQNQVIYSKPSINGIQGKPMAVEHVQMILQYFDSPMLESSGDIVLESKETGIRTSFAMALWLHEGKYGTKGVAASHDNPGNLRCHYGALCAEDGFAMYATWTEGIHDWFVLMQSYIRHGLITTETVVPVYAPPSDGNDDGVYIEQVNKVMEDYDANTDSIT